MGVKGLQKIIVKFAPDSIEKHPFSHYNQTTQSLDASAMLYAFCIATMKTENFKNEDGEIISHIFACFFKSCSMLKYGIMPLWVFDGKPPEMKLQTINYRRKVKQNASERLEKEKDLSPHEIYKLEKKTFSINAEHIDDIKNLLEIMGLPYSESPGEAEAQCVAFNRANVSNGVVTADWDALLFGCKKMLKDFSNKNDITEINLEKLLKSLGMTHSQLIDLGFLLGNDYCQGISMNPIDIYTKFKNVNFDIKMFLEKEKYNIPENFFEQMEFSRDYYLNAPVVDPKNIEITWHEPNYEALYKYLVEDKKLSNELIVPKINELRLLYSYYRQFKRLVTLSQIRRELNMLDSSSSPSYYDNHNKDHHNNYQKFYKFHHNNSKTHKYNLNKTNTAKRVIKSRSNRYQKSMERVYPICHN